MSTRIGYRYAKAFFDEGKQRGCLNSVIEDMSLIAETVHRDPVLKRVINDPSLTSEKKLAVLEEIFSKHVNESTGLFLKFLALKKRIGIIEDVAHQLKAIYRNSQNIVKLIVTLSSGLDEQFGNELVKKLAQVTGYQFEATIHHDASLVGGFVYAFEGKVFDYSIKGKLQKLEKQLI